MAHLNLDQSEYVLYAGKIQECKCYQYAITELCRLFKKVNIELTVEHTDTPHSYQLGIGSLKESVELPDDDCPSDSFIIDIQHDDIQLASRSAKGVLNAVYDLMEQLGYTYLLPGEKGEWAPENGLTPLPIGRQEHIPRFPYRGVFWQPLSTEDFTHDQWLRFYAKLKFNAVSCNVEDLALCEALGIRLEIGGHGFSHLLPRDQFDQKPELFRMFQPEDFGGKRLNDSNMCITNSETRHIVKENFRKDLKEAEGAYAIHAWADDLPAGGWCLCPTCRAFSPEDQSMLAMRLLAEVCREENSSIRIPVIAYHDTMYPGKNIDPADENFLLFAPRERCYGHALDDQNCERNKFYMEALKQWQKTFAGIDDSHTFEYYFDQILFRGMYPFLPQTVIDDMSVYADYGIESHLSLQVGGPAIAPEYNMLLFSKAHWNKDLDAQQFCQQMAGTVAAQFAAPWADYLIERGRIFQRAMQMCDYDVTIYLDYRWLPENTSEFGRKMAVTYQQVSTELSQAADRLHAAIIVDWPERLSQLAQTEVKRAEFEAAELQAMHYQQKAMNEFAAYLNTNDKGHAKAGCQSLRHAIEQMAVARTKAEEFGLPENSWYFNNINKWQSNEFKRKIANYENV